MNRYVAERSERREGFDRAARKFAAMETERLVLREPGEHDAEQLRDYYVRNAERFAPWEPPRGEDLASHRAWIAAVRQARIDGEPAVFLAFDRISHALVAVADVHGFSGPERSAMLAYTVDGAYEGRGYASEVVAAVLRHAAETLRLKTITAHYDIANARSARLLERAGFRVVGETLVVPGLEHLMRAHRIAERVL